MSSSRERSARLRLMVENYFETVWCALQRLGVPEASLEDSAQEVFLVASRRLDEITRGDYRGYLLEVALRVAAQARRALSKKGRELLVDGQALDSTSPGTTLHAPDEALEQKRALALLASVLDKMSEELREAFILFEFGELSASEVANVLEVPVGTVASRVRRAREQLRRALSRRATRLGETHAKASGQSFRVGTARGDEAAS
ncbi:MAG TPA: sigma-70 family RNA polymerase sigma factor [Polyangiaceae bacterium]